MSPLCLHQPTPSRDVLLVPMAAHSAIHSKPVSPKALPYYSLCTPEHNSWTQDEGLIAPKSLLDLPIYTKLCPVAWHTQGISHVDLSS